VDTDSESPTLPLKERMVAGVANMLVGNQHERRCEPKDVPSPDYTVKDDEDYGEEANGLLLR
jgi:hypothetical protein